MTAARDPLLDPAPEAAPVLRAGSGRFGREPPGLVFDWLERAGGVRLRHAHVRTDREPARGTMVILPGRTEYIEKYYETGHDLLERGLDVAVLDWRGQGRSQRLLSHAHRGYVVSYEDYLADLADYFDQVLAERARPPLYLLAHSMGAHLALRFLHSRPTVVAGAVLNAPMVDLRRRALPRPLLRVALRAALRLGLHGSYLPGHGDHSGLHRPFERNRLTGCPQRFAAMRALMERTEGVALGGATYQWLQATLESIAVVERPGFAERITTPALILSAGLDRVVCNLAQARLAARLPRGRLQVIEGARHEILMERDAVRAAFFAQLDAFLEELAGEAGGAEASRAGVPRARADAPGA